jgi:glycosyltransferase involved in cell wall biosynthesis
MALYIFNGYWEGLRLIRQWKPDVIHVHFAVPAGVLGWLFSNRVGIPYLLTAHLGDVPGGVPEKTGKWFRFIFPLTPPIWNSAARVVAVSEYTRSLAQKSYSIDIQVIPNGVAIRDYDPGEIQVHDPPEIVFAGRFMPQKNPVQVVRTLGELQYLPWHCTMAGDGPLRPEVETEIERLGLQGRISLPGWITPEEVIAQFGKSDILFMPSLSEGLPVVGVQAMALGLALVAGNVGGFIDLVHPGENGYLVNPHDEMGFNEALRMLLIDREALLGARRASRRLSADFDLDQIVSRYENILHDIVDQRRK